MTQCRKRTPLDTLDFVLERFLVHLSLFDLLNLNLFSVLLEISLSFGSFGLLDSLSILSVLTVGGKVRWAYASSTSLVLILSMCSSDLTISA